MFEVYGHFYSEDIEKFNEVVATLEANGYSIAYDHPTNATIIKEVDDEQS